MIKKYIQYATVDAYGQLQLGEVLLSFYVNQKHLDNSFPAFLLHGKIFVELSDGMYALSEREQGQVTPIVNKYNV